VAKLKSSFTAAVQTPAFRAALAKQGATVREAGADAFAKLIDSETKRWTTIIRDAGLKF
jgi:tripartite-type tricarboxylate transporter receptor subunit TctC